MRHTPGVNVVMARAEILARGEGLGAIRTQHLIMAIAMGDGGGRMLLDECGGRDVAGGYVRLFKRVPGESR